MKSIYSYSLREVIQLNNTFFWTLFYFFVSLTNPRRLKKLSIGEKVVFLTSFCGDSNPIILFFFSTFVSLQYICHITHYFRVLITSRQKKKFIFIYAALSLVLLFSHLVSCAHLHLFCFSLGKKSNLIELQVRGLRKQREQGGGGGG